MVERHRGALAAASRAVTAEMAPPAASELPPPRPLTKAEARQRERQAARDARFRQVAELATAGHGIRAIVRQIGLARNTVRGRVRRGSAPTWNKGQRARIIDPHLPHLQRRLDEGATNATALWREIRATGFPGRVVGVRAVVAELRGTPARPASSPAPLWWRPCGGVPRRGRRRGRF